MDDAAEAAWLYGQSQQVRGQDYWLGLDDLATEGDWRWIDGRRPTYTNWNGGEPNNAGNNEDCGHLWGQNGRWNDLPCNRAIGVLCEDVCDPATDADGDGASGCGADCDDADPATHPGARDLCLDGIDQDCNGDPDDGAGCLDCDVVLRGPHRYVVCATRRTWDQARTECQNLGMDLAMLKTRSETQDLANEARLRGPNFYFGLTDRAREGTFGGWTGRRRSRSFWGRASPMTSRWPRTGELTTNSSTWNDIPCSNNRGFICEATCPPGPGRRRGRVPRCDGDCDGHQPRRGPLLPVTGGDASLPPEPAETTRRTC
ncbi:MAG: lectin-like protein [bacterium]